METAYDGRVRMLGLSAGYRGGEVKGLYQSGPISNIATFHRNIVAGLVDNTTVQPALDANYACFLGREACARGTRLTMAGLLKENKALVPDLSGLKGMGRVIYHVDGKGVARHLEVILDQPEIQAIQWVQGLGDDWLVLPWLPLLQRTLDAGKSVLVDLPIEELDEFMNRMPREGVFLCLGVQEGKESEILKRIERWGR